MADHPGAVHQKRTVRRTGNILDCPQQQVLVIDRRTVRQDDIPVLDILIGSRVVEDPLVVLGPLRVEIPAGGICPRCCL